MICLTGDVHHMSLRTNDQRYLAAGETEVGVARGYVELAERYNTKLTLYVCGKCFTEEWSALARIVQSPVVEVGGHGFRARYPRPLFDWYGRSTGDWNGPRWYQAWDIRRTLEVCERRTGRRPVCWRGHSYMADLNTYPLLAAAGVRFVSDEIRSGRLHPHTLPEGLVSHPINAVPDHDHLYHAHRTVDFVERANHSGYGADEFGAVSYSVEQWGALALRHALEVDRRCGVATVLAHPICMYLADGFKSFERLLAGLAAARSVWASEIVTATECAADAGKDHRG
jgi:hypothetical protein